MRLLAHVVSQYAWIGILGIFLLIPFFITPKTEGASIKSLTKTFDSSILPGVFTHLSDVHVNHVYPKYNDQFETALKIIRDKMGSPLTVITGDLVDNWPEEMPRYGTQNKEDLEIYLNLLKKYSIEPIEVAGNHDMFGVWAFNSEESYYAKSKNWTENEFKVSMTAPMEIGGEKFYFLRINPFEFPTAHPPLMYWITPSSEYLDLIEDALDELNDENAHIIALTHFPYDMWKYEPKSKKGRTFKDIVDTGRFTLLLDGHMHISEARFLHHGQSLEVVGTDLIAHEQFAVVTVDNGRIAYHVMNINNPKLTFVTAPVNKEHLSSHQVFNDPGQIRIISYQDAEPVITATVDGKKVDIVCGKEPSYHLCASANLELEKGVHTLVLGGDMNESFEFLVADETGPYSERLYGDAHVEHFVPIFAIILFFVLIIVVPFPLPKGLEIKYNDWMTNEGYFGESYWLFTVFGGFLAIKMRINKLPFYYRVALFIGGILPLFCPTIITSVEGHIGGVWTYGHVCGGTAYYDHFGLIISIIYTGGVFLPILLLFSGLSVGMHKALFIDVIPAIASVAYDFYTCLRWCNEAAGPWLSILSPGFSLSLMFFYTSAAVLFVTNAKSDKGIPSVALLGQRDEF